MPLTINFNDTELVSMTLAKVGNPIRDEPLTVSQAHCQFNEDDSEMLTSCFLRPFRSLEQHHLDHHSEIESNDLYGYATKVFEDRDSLVEQGGNIARHLYDKSRHPNIKSGDLCVSLIDHVGVSGAGELERRQALCIIKSESKVPFLQISEHDGDLRLTTQQGIYPEKIDKGCLIIDHGRADGYAVYLFDKSGGSTQFWKHDFVGAAPVKDEDYLTRHYSKLCVDFADKGLAEDTPQQERMEVADRAISYLEDSEQFDLDDFKSKTLETPERIEQFDSFKADYEEENDKELEDKFTVSQPEAKKARKRLKSRLKLDVGVELRFSSGFITAADQFLERGHDDDKGMEYVKVWYHKEV